MLARTLLLAFLAASTFSLNKASDSTDQIRATRQEIDSAFQRHDAKQLTVLFSSDCHFTGPSVHIDGSDALKRFYERLFLRRPDVELAHHASRIVVNKEWDLASEHGDWSEHWTEKDGIAELHGSYLVLWKRDGGKWQEYSEMIVPETCSGSAYCHQK